MQVNFTDEEYTVLKELANHWRCWPAALVHRLTMQAAWAELHPLLEARGYGSGSREGSGADSDSLPRSTPLPPAQEDDRAPMSEQPEHESQPDRPGAP